MPPRGVEPHREPIPGPEAAPEVPIGGVVVAMHARAVDPIALARHRLQGIRLARGAVAALAMSLGTWAVYRGSWVGTTGDLVGVAVLAFFTDFTLDAVVGAVSALKRPVPGP
jgi:hypothetical protein